MPRPPNENKNVKEKWTQKYGELLNKVVKLGVRTTVKKMWF